MERRSPGDHPTNRWSVESTAHQRQEESKMGVSFASEEAKEAAQIDEKRLERNKGTNAKKRSTDKNHDEGEDRLQGYEETGAASDKPQKIKKPSTGRNGRLLPPDFKPMPYSVVIGRGREAKEHVVGNERLKVLVSQLLPQYANAKNRKSMSKILSSVVSTVREACPGGEGAFVKLGKDGRWYEVSEAAAREKVGYTFRDMLGDRYHSSSQSKVARKRQLRDEASGQTRRDSATSEHHEEDPSSSTATASLAAIVHDYTSMLLESSQQLTQAIAEHEEIPGSITGLATLNLGVAGSTNSALDCGSTKSSSSVESDSIFLPIDSLPASKRGRPESSPLAAGGRNISSNKSQQQHRGVAQGDEAPGEVERQSLTSGSGDTEEECRPS